MTRLVLVGGGGKRADYFQKAAEAEEAQVCHCGWKEYLSRWMPGDIVKLDPPSFFETDLKELPRFVGMYRRLLEGYAALDGVRYLNHPHEILAALDKRETRRRLMDAAVPVAPGLTAASYEELVRTMEESGFSRVFIKPRFGSGAAGVLAYARSGGREALYTSLREVDGGCRNTKRVRVSQDAATNRRIIDYVLALDAVVERWISKASHGGVVYDLRVVWQFGKIAAVVARGAKGPITNLHLNNMVLEVPLPDSRLADLEALCGRTLDCFPDLRVAGVDVLTPKGDGPPLVLEINAQGDLLYRDIYAENRIYREQAAIMKGWNVENVKGE